MQIEFSDPSAVFVVLIVSFTMAFFLLVVCWMSFADKTVRKAVASAENIKTFEAANNTRGLSSHMKVQGLFSYLELTQEALCSTAF